MVGCTNMRQADRTSAVPSCWPRGLPVGKRPPPHAMLPGPFAYHSQRYTMLLCSLLSRRNVARHKQTVRIAIEFSAVSYIPTPHAVRCQPAYLAARALLHQPRQTQQQQLAQGRTGPFLAVGPSHLLGRAVQHLSSSNARRQQQQPSRLQSADSESQRTHLRCAILYRSGGQPQSGMMFTHQGCL